MVCKIMCFNVVTTAELSFEVMTNSLGAAVHHTLFWLRSLSKSALSHTWLFERLMNVSSLVGSCLLPYLFLRWHCVVYDTSQVPRRARRSGLSEWEGQSHMCLPSMSSEKGRLSAS